MAQSILVISEQREGRLNPATLETLTAAQHLAAELGAGVVVAVLDAAAADDPPGAVTAADRSAATNSSAGAAPNASAAATLAGYAVERVVRAAHPALSVYTADVWTQALVQIVTHVEPRFVLLPHTYQVRDFAPRLATRMARGLISDVTGFRREGDGVVFTRPMFQGKWAAEVAMLADSPGFATIQIGAFRGDQAQRGSAAAPIEDLAVSPAPSQYKPGEIFTEAKQAVDLGQAERIVAAGRGIKEQKNLELVRQLAEKLGAEIAASRPICDSGWLPLDRQIGSSGQTVAPKLYIALGISGAIQHVVGMKGARTIVAINKDPEAPIFEIADYGIVGDLFDIVPAMIEALG